MAAFDLTRNAAIGTHAKLILSLNFKEFGGLIEHRRDLCVLYRNCEHSPAGSVGVQDRFQFYGMKFPSDL